MPAKGQIDESKRNAKGILASVQASREKYAETQEQLIIRLPKGTKAILQEYVQAKAAQEPENQRYNNYNGKCYTPSLNALIIALLEEETHTSLKPVH